MALADGGGGGSAATRAAIPKKKARDGSALSVEGPVSAAPSNYRDTPETVLGLAPAKSFEAELGLPPALERGLNELALKAVPRENGSSDLAASTLLSANRDSVIRGQAPQQPGTSSAFLELNGVGQDDIDLAEKMKPLEKPDIEREMVESKERATRRGMNARSTGKTEAMTLEEYQALNPKQRAAVDLNTMLAAAVKDDLKGRVNAEPDADYRAQLAELGIEEGQRYAPETVNLLDRINYEADGEKLGDFLKLKIGFTAADLDRLEAPRPGEGPDASLATASKQREGLQAALVNSIKTTRQDPERASLLFETQQKLTGSNQIPGMGAANPQGSIDEQRNYFFQDMFARLALTDEKGQKGLMSKIEGQLTDDDMAAFNTYLQVRSRESKQYSLPLTTGEGTDPRSPKQFRAELGLNR